MRVARVALGEGVRKLRVTGGEPLVRRDVTALIASLAALPGLDDLSLTTNGVLLEELRRGARARGLEAGQRQPRHPRSGPFRQADAAAIAFPTSFAVSRPRAMRGSRRSRSTPCLLRGENEHEAVDLVALRPRPRLRGSVHRVHAAGERSFLGSRPRRERGVGAPCDRRAVADRPRTRRGIRTRRRLDSCSRTGRARWASSTPSRPRSARRAAGSG